MATIRDVSKASGLSIATVSRALRTPEKVSQTSLKKVQEVIDKLGYRPNMLSQKFRHKRANTLVVLVPNIDTQFFLRVIIGIEQVAQKNGYSVLIGDTRNSTERELAYINLVETRQADGVIQLSPHCASSSSLPRAHVPTVSAVGIENTPYPTVRIDNVAATRTVVDYLLANGHKRIGVISGLKDNPNTIIRIAGYQQSLAAAGIEFEPSLIIEGNFRLHSGLNAAENFARMDINKRPTAIICMNDEMAIGAIKGLKNYNLKVPDDISVTGFDNIELSNYSDPPLTTVSQPAVLLGEKSAELLIQLINGEQPSDSDIILPYEFIIRKSSGALKKTR